MYCNHGGSSSLYDHGDTRRIDVVKGLQQLFEAVVYMTVIIGVLGVGVNVIPTHWIGVWLAHLGACGTPRLPLVRGPERNNDGISVSAWADKAILAHARVHDPDIPPREVYLDSGARIGVQWGVEIEGIGPEVSNTPTAESG
ncbi:hypothetical protein B0H16DRAFT_1450815 [Mycena metata]|uniref:Uncharacterized protein n=1 Tax=Mycena metata TaxID=1033252 RepID=A0AAD7JXL5_9AGAR|nr:hypothetical protein B0H16DRAFT_1450815 [Mycena metata]